MGTRTRPDVNGFATKTKALAREITPAMQATGESKNASITGHFGCGREKPWAGKSYYHQDGVSFKAAF